MTTPSIDLIKLKELRARIDKTYDDLEEQDRAINGLTGLDKLRDLNLGTLKIDISATGDLDVTSAAAIYMRKAVVSFIPQIIDEAIRLAKEDLRKSGAAV